MPTAPDDWHTSAAYLLGVDLYNFAYWWECHEVFEGFWHAVGRRTEQGQFFQALIHMAAANLKRFLGNRAAADRLGRAALIRFQALPHRYMGIDVRALEGAFLAYMDGSSEKPALIRLFSPDGDV